MIGSGLVYGTLPWGWRRMTYENVHMLLLIALIQDGEIL